MWAFFVVSSSFSPLLLLLPSFLFGYFGQKFLRQIRGEGERDGARPDRHSPKIKREDRGNDISLPPHHRPPFFFPPFISHTFRPIHCSSMKKLKGVAATEPDPSPSAVPLEDPRGRFKFQSLLQDYQDLLRETDAMNRKMLLMKQRKMILQAEVRFLRQRFEFLTVNNPLHLKRSQNTIKGKGKLQVSENKSKRSVKKQNCPARRTDGVADLNKKSRVENAKKAVLRIPTPRLAEKDARVKGIGHHKFLPDFDLNQGDLVPVPMKNSGLEFDLNQKERNRTGMEALMRNPAPIFDLNQVSRDEEDVPNNNAEPIGMEEGIRSSVHIGSEEQLNSVKLPGCMTSGNGSDRAGKRKITWEDQMALKV